MKECLTGTAGALLLSGAACGQRPSQSSAADPANRSGGGRPKRSPRLVIVRDREYARTGRIDPSRLLRQLQMALSQLTGAEDHHEAWRAFIDRSDMVGLKVNCLGGPQMSSHPQVATAIARELKGVGVSRQGVVVWDRMRRELLAAGYDTEFDDFLCKATDDESVGHEEDLEVAGQVGACFSRLLTSQCTAALNLPLVKDHGIVGATCSLKNWLGSISNPNKLHHNHGDPMIADLNLAEAIQSKRRLIVCDAFDVLYHGGPSYKPGYVARYGALIVGTDPVALDTYAVRLIEAERHRAKLPTLAQEKRDPTYIARAADAQHQLGEADLNRVDVVELTV